MRVALFVPMADELRTTEDDVAPSRPTPAPGGPRAPLVTDVELAARFGARVADTSRRDEPQALLVVAVDATMERPGQGHGSRFRAGDEVMAEVRAAAPVGAVVTVLDDGSLAAFFPGTRKSDALDLADRALSNCRKRDRARDGEPVSIGVAGYPSDGRVVSALVAAAAMASRRAARGGGSAVLGFHPGMLSTDDEPQNRAFASYVTADCVPIDFRPILRGDGSRLGLAASLSPPAAVAGTVEGVYAVAARVGRVLELGRLARASALAAFREFDDGRLWLSVGVHPAELHDATLIAGEPGFEPIAERLIARILPFGEPIAAARAIRAVSHLRARGVRICIDDLVERSEELPLETSALPDVPTRSGD